MIQTHRQKSVQDGDSDVKSFLQQPEAIVNLDKPVNEDGSHFIGYYWPLAHISWVDVEFTLKIQRTKSDKNYPFTLKKTTQLQEVFHC